jgi:aspartokinase/homoserine dehydrogenase 1
MQLLERRHKHFLFEANVGAGLPVVSTLRDLIASGDEVVKIEGILSGTLSYLFNTFDGRSPFSSLIREAHRMGFTEPDPREDLSGMDVARKLLILARQIGLTMDLDEVRVDSLVPKALARGKFSDRVLTGFERTTGRWRAASRRRQRAATSCGKSARSKGRAKAV